MVLVQVACRRPFGPLAAGLALAPRGGRRGLGVRLFLVPFGPTSKFKGRGALCSDSESVYVGLGILGSYPNVGVLTLIPNS